MSGGLLGVKKPKTVGTNKPNTESKPGPGGTTTDSTNYGESATSDRVTKISVGRMVSKSICGLEAISGVRKTIAKTANAAIIR